MSKVWRPVVFRVLKGEENVPSPFVENTTISSLFVVVKEEGNTKLGYGVLWCPVTFRRIHLSRMEVPDYLYSVTADEMESMKLQDIKFEDLE